MTKPSLRPVLAMLSAAAVALAVALAIAAGAFAQAPPAAPHQFFGSEPTGSGPVLDGAPAPDGAMVTAWNEAGVALATSTFSGGFWTLQIDPADAGRVVFTINGSLPSGSFEVRAAAFEEVRLDLSSPAGEDAPSDGADDTTARNNPATDDAPVAGDAPATDDAPVAGEAIPDDAPAADTAAADAAAADTPPESFGMPEAGSGGLAGGGSRIPVLSLIFAISALAGMGGVMTVRRRRA